jgi:hypothetical protein
MVNVKILFNRIEQPVRRNHFLLNRFFQTDRFKNENGLFINGFSKPFINKTYNCKTVKL